MQAVTYDDVSHPLRPEFAESHTRFWQRLHSAGTWFTAEQRIAIAAAVREAADCEVCDQRKKALSPRSIQGQHSHSGTLPATVVEAVHAIVNDASRLKKDWYEGAKALYCPE